MIAEPLQDRAALFVAGAMTAAERESFEVLLEYLVELRAQVAKLQEAVAAVEVASAAGVPPPPAALRERILGAVAATPQRKEPEALVVTGPAGMIEWVNEAFVGMCGHRLDELKGRKPGAVLQGAGTEPDAVARIREAMRRRQPCRETLLNYHKDGSPYRVDLRISPILDDTGEPLYFVAREQKLAEVPRP